MRFDGLDLNLLVALNALLDERNVSVAAERMHLSQGAMSAALGRLRDYFKDELLVSVGRRMLMTPRAEQLAGPVRNALLQIRSTITTQQQFDPATSDRHVTIIASDYFLRVALADALCRIALEAPLMTFDVGDLEDEPAERLRRGEIDIMITIESFLAFGHPTDLVFEDEYVVVGWADNPAMKRPMDAATFSSLGQVTVSHGVTRVPTFAELELRNRHIERKIEMVAPGFSEVAYLLVGTNRISVMHKRLADLMAKTMPLISQPLPFEFPKVRILAQWNSILSGDQALSWVIQKIKETAQRA